MPISLPRGAYSSAFLVKKNAGDLLRTWQLRGLAFVGFDSLNSACWCILTSTAIPR